MTSAKISSFSRIKAEKRLKFDPVRPKMGFVAPQNRYIPRNLAVVTLVPKGIR
ncbi:MAG: hypothetical protein IKE69_06855 [Thermoguttaceae bacterium]|nr:hypothetical protein [Thermoguttaceae bacterium]